MIAVGYSTNNDRRRCADTHLRRIPPRGSGARRCRHLVWGDLSRERSGRSAVRVTARSARQASAAGCQRINHGRTRPGPFPSVNQPGSVRSGPMTRTTSHDLGIPTDRRRRRGDRRTDGSERSSDANHNDTSRMRAQKKARQIRDQRPHQRQPSRPALSVASPARTASNEFHKCRV